MGLLAGWVNTQEAAEATGYTTAYVCKLARDGKVEAVKDGRDWHINLESLMAYQAAMARLGDSKHNPLAPWRDVGGREA